MYLLPCSCSHLRLVALDARYVTTSLANLDASLVALRNVKTYHAIEDNTEVITTAIAFTAPIEVVLDININYYLESWLPFKTNQLNMQTVLPNFDVRDESSLFLKWKSKGYELNENTGLM